jgi:hypothetical protein
MWKYLVLIQTRYVCTLKMGYCSLSCGWMEIRFNIASYITVCTCYPPVRLLDCLPRELALHFTVCLLTNCCADMNTAAKCWSILPKGTYIIWMFGWKCWPPLWSSGQSSWLQIRRPGFYSWYCQKKSSGSGTGSTQPREYNWGANW